jgi:hypothetical protein
LPVCNSPDQSLLRAIRPFGNPDLEVDDGDEIDDSNVALHTRPGRRQLPLLTGPALGQT